MFMYSVSVTVICAEVFAAVGDPVSMDTISRPVRTGNRRAVSTAKSPFLAALASLAPSRGQQTSGEHNIAVELPDQHHDNVNCDEFSWLNDEGPHDDLAAVANECGVMEDLKSHDIDVAMVCAELDGLLEPTPVADNPDHTANGVHARQSHKQPTSSTSSSSKDRPCNHLLPRVESMADGTSENALIHGTHTMGLLQLQQPYQKVAPHYGYIYDAVPEDKPTRLGRVTEWPDKVKSRAVKCYVHGCSKTWSIGRAPSIGAISEWLRQKHMTKDGHMATVTGIQ
jgi:hypothetical protein